MKKYSIIVLLMLLGACDNSSRNYTPTDAAPTNASQNVIQQAKWDRGRLWVVTLDDGTNCVVTRVLDGGGGVDCNWKQESSQDE